MACERFAHPRTPCRAFLCHPPCRSIRGPMWHAQMCECIDRDLAQRVMQPPEVDTQRWMHILFTEMHRRAAEVNVVLQMVCNCKDMTIGTAIYKWQGEDDKTALDYTLRVLRQTSLKLGSPSDARAEEPFPLLMKRIFRIYAHAYYHHLEVWLQL